ncbi:MAG: cell envelope integrity protein CreD [Verrucomicrobia bacterium]|nr:cell envelope integrity protein CreD [Verrucomicrobiota bacterium]
MNPTSPAPTPPVIPDLAERLVSRNRTLIKMITIGCLVLLGLIPLALIRGVLSERRQRHAEAMGNITSTWGNPQVIAGPWLVVPYQRQVKGWTEQMVNGRMERIETSKTVVARANFLPAELSIAGDLQPDRLHRGIYEAVVYRSALQVSGHFARPSFDEWKVAPEDVLWDEAMVGVAISDLRGAKEALRLKWGDQTLPLVPGPKAGKLGTSVQARLPKGPLASETLPFEFALSLNGSGSLSFAPFGMLNRVRLTSPFPDPSFNGAYLPETRKVTADGFEAEWRVGYYGRGYPHQWSDASGGPLENGTVASSLFGVGVLPVVDSYRYVERSIKYGILFLTLVFTTFFLFEVRTLARVHPFQYTLVGAALCLFYLALLALSEVLPFGWAYLAGAAAATLLVAAYSAVVLQGAARAWLMGGGLAAVYGLLFVILRQQEYALLYGTGALFVALAAAMYATRKLDWYARD